MKLVIILASMSRAGIDFFQSLLDRHTQISQLPGKFFIDEFLHSIKNIETAEQIGEKFIKDHEEYFDSKINLRERHDKLGENKDESFYVNKFDFLKNFTKLLGKDIKDKKKIIFSINLAYSKASGEDISKKKIIVINVHHLHRIESIADLEFEILCTTRDPIASFSSYVKHWGIKNNFSNYNPWKFYYHLNRCLYGLAKLTMLKKKIMVIRLEDLHKNNLLVMKNVCRNLNINYEKELSISSYHGKKWWGDFISTKDLNGVNPEFENKISQNLFFKKDIFFIEKKLKNFYQKYDYPIRSARNYSIFMFLPFKFELILLFKNIMKLNFKHIFFCLYFYLIRILRINKNDLDLNNYPIKM